MAVEPGAWAAALLTKSLGDFDLKADRAGHLEATFSRFGVVDRDGDVTLPSAFTDGQRVPMVWSHKWDQPVGDGVIQVKTDRAVFVGEFWLDTLDGEQAYKKVKRAGDLQDYSYGFAIKDAAPAAVDGQQVRILKSLEVYEVSPVLVGAGIGTRTESLKAAEDAYAELKAGRRLSAASRAHVLGVIEALTAFLRDPEQALEEATEEPAKTLLPVTGDWVAQFRARYHKE